MKQERIKVPDLLRQIYKIYVAEIKDLKSQIKKLKLQLDSQKEIKPLELSNPSTPIDNAAKLTVDNINAIDLSPKFKRTNNTFLNHNVALSNATSNRNSESEYMYHEISSIIPIIDPKSDLQIMKENPFNTEKIQDKVEVNEPLISLEKQDHFAFRNDGFLSKKQLFISPHLHKSAYSQIRKKINKVLKHSRSNDPKVCHSHKQQKLYECQPFDIAVINKVHTHSNGITLKTSQLNDISAGKNKLNDITNNLISTPKTYLLKETQNMNSPLFYDLSNSNKDNFEILSPVENKINKDLNLSFNDSFDVPPKKSYIPNVKQKNKLPRKFLTKQRLKTYACPDCKQYYEFMKQESDSGSNFNYKDFDDFLQKNSCKHKAEYVAPSTPEHFWSIGMPDTQECRERGYINDTQYDANFIKKG